MPDLPRPAGEKQQGASFVTHESMGKSLGSQKRVLGRVIGVEKRLGNAEKKITIMKNIMKMRKSSDNIGSTIQGIADSVEAIAETTTEQYDLEKDKAEDARISGEKDDAKKDESNLEKGWGSFKGTVGKVLAPVSNMFKRLVDFVKTFLFGAGVISLLEWFQNPDNIGKIKNLFRFLKDWWPILVTGLLLLIGTFVGPGALWIAGILAVAAVIPPIINGVKSIFGMGKNVDKELDPEKGKKLAEDGVNGVEKGSEKGIPPEVEEGEKKADEMKNLQEPQKFKEGGFVSGPAGEDKVPARLTAGEFVMSKGAVQKYGQDTLAGMNAAAGGTNTPSFSKGRGGYSQGGEADYWAGRDTSHFGTEGYRTGQIRPEMYVYSKENYLSTYRTKGGEVIEDTEDYTEISGSIAVEDLIANQKQLMGKINKIEGYEDTSIIDVIERANGRGRLVGMPDEQLYPILNASDAWKATDRKTMEGIRMDGDMNMQFLNPDKVTERMREMGVPGFFGGGLVGKLPQVRAAKWLGGKAKNAMSFVRNKLQSPPPPPTSKSGAKFQINVPAGGGGAMVGSPQKTGTGIPSFSVVAGGGMAKEQTLGIRR